MKICPYCAEDIQDAAIKCKHCGEILESSGPGRPEMPRSKPLRKSKRNSMVMGVCAGLADNMKMDVSIVRLLAALVIIGTFPIGLIVYIVAGFILPEGD